MASQKTFCNVPWSNTHVYWDGSYGVCCSERHKPHAQDSKYNIKNMSVVEWYNSDVMNGIRSKIQSGEKLSMCEGCYREEEHGLESRRIKENFKSAIFTEQAFENSYKQSPWFGKFETMGKQDAPIDWHVDLGNECNLSCKMCNPNASSQIAAQYKKWNIFNGNVQTNWTQDDSAWDRFTQDISAIDKLNRIHFMGGEPTMSKRFIEFLEHMISIKKTDVSISFVTNGTRINERILELLDNFRTYDIEVSIESIHANNHYIRQGSDTKKVIDNILYLKSRQSDKCHVVLRTVPQLLNVNNYGDLLLWAFENQLPVQSIPLINPPHYQISVLPEHIKSQLVIEYTKFKSFFEGKDTIPSGVVTGRLVSAIPRQLARDCGTIISMLNAPDPSNVEQLRRDLVMHTKRWDNIYEYNALEFYPEYKEFLIDYGY